MENGVKGIRVGRQGFHLIKFLIVSAVFSLAASACGATRSIYDLEESQINRNETISLHFDWSAGLAAEVQSSIHKTRTVGKERTEKSVQVQCELHTESAVGGIRVRCENGTMDGEEALTLFMDGAPGLPAQPVLMVDSHGTITKIEELIDVRSALEQALVGEPARLSNTRQIIDVLSDPKTVTDVAGQEWWNLVAFWNGKALKTGTTYDTRRPFKVPTSGATIDWVQHYTLAGRVPCTEDDKARSCVKLVLTSTPDRGQFDAVVQGMRKKSSPAWVLRGVEYRYTLVTRPERLLPYWVEDRRTMQLDTVDAAGKGGIVEVVDERHDRYEYFATGLAGDRSLR